MCVKSPLAFLKGHQTHASESLRPWPLCGGVNIAGVSDQAGYPHRHRPSCFGSDLRFAGG